MCWTTPALSRRDGQKSKWKTSWDQGGRRLIRCGVTKGMCGGRRGRGIMFVCHRRVEVWRRRRVRMGIRILRKILGHMGRLGQRRWGRLFLEGGVCEDGEGERVW